MPGNWWPFRRRPRLPGLRVVVYTRSNCPLCDKAAEFLDAQQQELGFALAYADTTDDPDLWLRYGDWVPVVEVNGKVRFRGAVNPVLWQRLITALTR